MDTRQSRCYNSEWATLTHPRALAPARHKISLWSVKRGHCKSASVPAYSPLDGTWLLFVFNHLTMKHRFLTNFGHHCICTGVSPFYQIYQNETHESAFSAKGACRCRYALPFSHLLAAPLNSISYMGEGDLSKEASEVDKSVDLAWGVLRGKKGKVCTSLILTIEGQLDTFEYSYKLSQKGSKKDDLSHFWGFLTL